MVLAGLAWSAALSADKIVVREAFPSKGADFWPNYVAETEGFYAKEGLDVRQEVVDPNITVSALIGSGVEVSFADSTQLLYALDKHADLVAFGLSTDRQPYRLMASPTVKSVAALKGKKIGATSEIDVYTSVIKMVLRKAKLDPDKDVVWIYGGNQTRRLANLVGGNVDAGLFSPPADQRLKELGYNGLAFTPEVIPDLSLSAESVRRDWAQRNGDTLRRLLRAEAEAVHWLNDPANKAQALRILMAQNGAGPADAEEAYDYFVGKTVWLDACIHPAGLVNALKIMRQLGQLKSITEADVSKFTDKQWCAQSR